MFTNLRRIGVKKLIEPPPAAPNPGASCVPTKNSIFGKVVLTYEAPSLRQHSICALSLVKEEGKDHAILVLEKLQRPDSTSSGASTMASSAPVSTNPNPKHDHVIHVGELSLVTGDGEPAPTLEALWSSSSGEGRVDFTKRWPKEFLNHFHKKPLMGISYQVSLTEYNAVFERMSQDADEKNPNCQMFTYVSTGHSQASSVSRSLTESHFHNCISYLIQDVLPLAGIRVSEDTWFANPLCPIKYPEYIFDALERKYIKISNVEPSSPSSSCPSNVN